ncbi:MAG: alpha/beta hydrolase [Desulfarculaceae bacterium]
MRKKFIMWKQHIADQKTGLRRGRTPFDPARPSLLCVHGAGGRGQGFLPQLSGLSSEINVAAIDLPGHGQTPGPSCERIEDYAHWLADFLQAGPLRPVLLGHSMGGAIAMTLALEHPGLLRGLVLVGTGAKLGVLPAILDGLLQDFAATVKMIVAYAYAPDADPLLLEQGGQNMSQIPPPVVHGDFSACNHFDIRERLHDIRMPVQIIVGDQDRLSPPRYAEYLKEHLPQARLSIIPGAGHMVHLEKHRETNQAVLDFMAGL